MRLLTKIFLACLLAGQLGYPLRGDTGREQSFADQNCALTVPADWQSLDGLDQPGLFAAFRNADRSRLVLLLVHGRGHPAAELSDAWIAAFERGVTKVGGGERLSGKIVQVAGYSAYERRGTSSVKAGSKSTLMLAIPTGDGTYLVEGLTSAGDAGEDAEIRQTLGTFHFLHLPGPPRDAAYWLGYRSVQFGLPALIVGLLVWLIVWVVTRSRRRLPIPPSSPYPSPSGAFPPPPPPPPPSSSPPPLPPDAR